MWLIIWWGGCNHQAPFSFLFWDFVVELFPLATPGEFPRDGTKMQHALSAWCTFSPWGLFIKMKLLCLNGGRGEKEPHLVQRKRECCIFFLTSWVSGLSVLTEGVCLTKQAGTCWHTWSSFLIGSSNGEKCLGIFFFFPLHNIAGSQENLPPKLFQSLRWLLCPGHKNAMAVIWWNTKLLENSFECETFM